ncbi:MAG: alpha/beta fold hydrolase [Candidatus Moranbacteria bacterium]|nr:alpha/beta fold hydrolase [Candidatus Moranbacteria bacterium]
MSVKRVFIIHGWEGTPDSNWFPWLKAELEKKRFEVAIPQMPNADFPKMSEWILHMRKNIGKPDENTYLIGHSLGAAAILRYLESLPAGEKIGGAILVAGVAKSIGIEELENFFAKSFDYEKIKNTAKKIIAVNSDNDPYVPLAHGETLRDKLGAKLIIVPKGEHLNAGNGLFEFPLVYSEILKMAGGK